MYFWTEKLCADQVFLGSASRVYSPKPFLHLLLELFSFLFCNYLAFCGSPSFLPASAPKCPILGLLLPSTPLTLPPFSFFASQSPFLPCVFILLMPLSLHSHFHLPLVPVLNSSSTVLLIQTRCAPFPLCYVKVSRRRGYTGDNPANVM